MTNNRRKMIFDITTINLEGRYTGWEFCSCTNPKLSVISNIASGSFDRIAAGLADTVTTWNFVDEDGNSIVSPSDLKDNGKTKEDIVNIFFELPIDLIFAMSRAVTDAIIAVPPN